MVIYTCLERPLWVKYSKPRLSNILFPNIRIIGGDSLPAPKKKTKKKNCPSVVLGLLYLGLCISQIVTDTFITVLSMYL